MSEKSINTKNSKSYYILPRKYRPKKLDDLIGQEVLVTSLKNSFSSKQIAHAFLFTGVRGVGKTSVARIVALGLNCSKYNEPTVSPCGLCSNCKEIIEDRYEEVLEIDAASHTGVDDIRTLTEGLKYRPVKGRYKVYIIDEVHMLSLSAFNALLKSIEEPPEYVKFIFCTTEVKKIPVTILSRCQRYDLKRVSSSILCEHINNIAQLDSIEISGEAVHALARISEGSVRDALSLLDQASSTNMEGKKVEVHDINEMVGLSDRKNIIDLLEALTNGEAKKSLDILSKLFDLGADPMIVIEELLSLTHMLSYSKATKNKNNGKISDDDYLILNNKFENISLPQIGRIWQMLIKAVEEMKISSNLYDALEMIIIRVTFAAELPDPSKLIESILSHKEISSEKSTTQNNENLIQDKKNVIASIEEKKDNNIEIDKDNNIEIDKEKEVKNILDNFPNSEIVSKSIE